MSDYFPYKSLRPNQEEFIGLVDEAVRKGENLIIEAPTGFGKTISVLAGVLPYAISMGFKVVYLARTHRQMDRVMEELKEINKINPVSGVELRSRKELCLHSYIQNFAPDAYNAMIVCKNLKKLHKCDHFENVKKKKDEFNEIVEYFLNRPSQPIEILQYSQLLELCPYEVTRKVGEKANVIVASYLYMLNPAIRNAFIESLGVDYEDLIVIFDEAHNLPDQAINVLSDKITINSIGRAIKEAEEYNEHEIANFLSIFLKGLENLYNERLKDREVEVPILPESIFAHVFETLNISEGLLIRILREMVEVGDAIREDKIEKNRPPRSYVGRVGEFLLNWLSLIGREDYLFMMSRDRGFSLELVALDPSKALDFINDVQSAIFMSGTLTPLEAFRDIMGIENARLKKFPGMVKKENALVLVAKDVSTRGEERNLELYRKMAEYIVEATRLIPKNVGVFTASYEVLQGLLSANVHLRIEEETGKKVFIEKKNASSKENDILVNAFKEEAKREGGVLLGVMGGRNSEGQDYLGDEMNGVVLVGIPYARPTPRVQAQIRYFEKKFPGKGKYYGYYLPAHRKLVQAAGRVHRSAEEKGAIIILDYRVLWNSIRKDLPDWMSEAMKPVNLPRLRVYLRRFYRNLEEEKI